MTGTRGEETLLEQTQSRSRRRRARVKRARAEPGQGLQTPEGTPV